MGGTKKLSKFIVDWENGTQVAYNNGAHRALRKCALTLHSCISVTDNIKISELKKSIATGPSTYTLNLKRIGRSYLKMWQFRTPWVIRSHNVGTELV